MSGMTPDFDKIFSAPSSETKLDLHFSQNEDFFIHLPKEIDIPSFPVHHDVRIKTMLDSEKKPLQEALEQLSPFFSSYLQGSRFFFDPTENQKPSFVQLMKIEEQIYACIIRFDLAFRASHGTITQKGSNDFTHYYKTQNIFIESDIVPLKGLKSLNQSSLELSLIQNISDTWIGETGRGYFVQGIWLDREISKFFSKLFTPKGLSLYPYYPLNCKFRSICMENLNMTASGRKKAVQFLHAARKYLEPRIESIELALRSNDFSEDLELFKSLKEELADSLDQYFKSYKIHRYLNQDEMKEYEITF